jgi:hypothetical protein
MGRHAYRIFEEKPVVNGHLKCLEGDGRIALTYIFREAGCKDGSEWN